MKSIILALTLLLVPTMVIADVWQPVSKSLPELLKDGYVIVGFDVDNSPGGLEPTKFRYLLQLKTESGNRAALCSETDRGSQHKCWIATIN